MQVIVEDGGEEDLIKMELGRHGITVSMNMMMKKQKYNNRQWSIRTVMSLSLLQLVTLLLTFNFLHVNRTQVDTKGIILLLKA